MDQPGAFIHFTGRPRQAGDPSPASVPASAEERLIKILETGKILAFPSYGSPPVVCISESTRGAVAGMVTEGVTKRGPYEPWGVLLKRAESIRAGFLPVLNLSKREQQAMISTSKLGPEIRGRFVTYDKTLGVDWLTEREWRYVPTPGQHLDLNGLILGIAVPHKGWEPPRDRDYSVSCTSLARFYLERQWVAPVEPRPFFVREEDLRL